MLVLSAEDDPARVLRPRFERHGADLSRIRFQAKPFTLDQHGLDLLRTEIHAHRPTLVIIDPLIAYMHASIDLHRANETTQFMNDLDQLVREFDNTIVVVRHLRKSDSNDPLYRGLGSIAIAARVRSILLLGRHPDEEGVRAVVHVKSNYAPAGPTILFEPVARAGDAHPKIRWLGTSNDIGADLLVKTGHDRGRPDNAREHAKDVLSGMIEGGPVAKEAILRAADARGISEMTLRRAADELGVRKFKKERKSYWSLP